MKSITEYYTNTKKCNMYITIYIFLLYIYIGKVSQNTIQILNNKVLQSKNKLNINNHNNITSGSSSTTTVRPTKLYAINKDVDTINMNELKKIDSQVYIYKAYDTGIYMYILLFFTERYSCYF